MNTKSQDLKTQWRTAKRGDYVALWKGATLFQAGTIEDRTADGTIIWIRDDLGYRRAFHIAEGLELTALFR